MKQLKVIRHQALKKLLTVPILQNIKECKNVSKEIEESKITLARRIDCIRDVIDDCHEDEGKKITVLDLLEGLGVFN